MKAILAIPAFYLARSLCAMVGIASICLILLMSLFLLLSTWNPKLFLKMLEQRIAAAGGLLGISYAACQYFWYFHGNLLGSRVAATAFYVGWHILGGMFAAMLICILAPRNMKALLFATSALLIAFSFLVIFGYATGRLIAALLFPSLGIGLLIGMSVHCGILFRREEGDKSKLSQSSEQVAVASRG